MHDAHAGLFSAFMVSKAIRLYRAYALLSFPVKTLLHHLAVSQTLLLDILHNTVLPFKNQLRLSPSDVNQDYTKQASVPSPIEILTHNH